MGNAFSWSGGATVRKVEICLVTFAKCVEYPEHQSVANEISQNYHILFPGAASREALSRENLTTAWAREIFGLGHPIPRYY